MKNIKKLGLAAFAVLGMALAIVSCNSDDGGSGSGGGTGTYIKAKINGVQFNTYTLQGQSFGSAIKTNSGLGTMIQISCPGEAPTAGSVKTMVINLMGITATGTYNVNPDSEGTFLAYVDSQTNGGVSYDTSNCSGAVGTITVTTLNDTKIEGTFNFTGKDDENCSVGAKTVTNGSFRGVFMN